MDTSFFVLNFALNKMIKFGLSEGNMRQVNMLWSFGCNWQQKQSTWEQKLTILGAMAAVAQLVKRP